MFKIRDYPYLTVEDQVFFPGSICGLRLGQQPGREAAFAAWRRESKTLAIFTLQGEGDGLDELYPIGVTCVIREFSDNEIEVEVLERVKLRDISRIPHPIAQVQLLELPSQGTGEELDERDGQLRELAERVFRRVSGSGRQATELLEEIEPGQYLGLVEFLAATLALPSQAALEILASPTVEEAQKHLLQALRGLLKSKRIPLLRPVSWPGSESEAEPGDDSVGQLRERIEELELEEAIMDRVLPELDKLERFDATLFEHQEAVSRLESLLAYPWHIQAEIVPRVHEVEKALDRTIHGHRRAKEQFLDLFATLRGKSGAVSPMLILTGPSGLGQGHFARSLAQALGRPMESINLLEDGVERLLLGSPRGPQGCPGALYQAALTTGAMDPLIHLYADSEISSATANVLRRLVHPRGSRQLLEAFLGLPIDVSRMLFILEIRSVEMVPERLRQHSVVLELEGYTLEEKSEILRRYLWPELSRAAGLGKAYGSLETSLVDWLLTQRTQETGVSNLKMLLSRLAGRLVRRGTSNPRVKPSLRLAQEVLGAAVTPSRQGGAVGVVGQAVLVDEGARVLEAAAFRSVQSVSGTVGESPALRDCVSLALGLGPAVLPQPGQTGWHLILPGPILPQDEATLGFSLALALRSASLELPVPRELAVLGRLGPAGEVLPVEHARDRALAAWRAGYRTLLLAPEQLPDLVPVLPPEVHASLHLLSVSSLEEAANLTLRPPRRPRSRGVRAA